ncbi:hypothetical protein GJ496_010845 [Pomphorhynchus laevis]|nr:hypothetical protein GJ496_010845 [Pomphorhynchus laevis]
MRNCQTATENISTYISKILNNIIINENTCLRNTDPFFLEIKKIKESIPDRASIVTLDVVQLYTYILSIEGIQSCIDVLKQNNFPDQGTDRIERLMHNVLKENVFIFDNLYWQHVDGTPTGTSMSPAYDNLFMARLEKHIIGKAINLVANKPTWWRRYIDDVIFVWPHGKTELLKFVDYLNNNSSVKFMCDQESTENIHYLDVSIKSIGKKMDNQCIKNLNSFQHVYMRAVATAYKYRGTLYLMNF